MSYIKLFSIKDKVEKIESTSIALEKSIQTLIERNMQEFFGVKFL